MKAKKHMGALMSDLPWLRLYGDIIDNEKVRLLAFEDRWHFIALLCIKRQGILDSKPELLERKIAVKLGLQLRDLCEVKRRLMEVELIDDGYNPIGWDEKQHNSDSSKERTRKYRENKKKQKCDGNETSQERHSDGLDTDTDTEKELIDTNVSIVGNEIPDCPHQEIISLYTKHLPMAIQPTEWDNGRASLLRSRWREKKKRQSLSWWDKFFEYISKSDFLTGKVNCKDRRPFEISLPWILKSSNFMKIIDGTYENK